MYKFNTLGCCEINNKKQITSFNDAFVKFTEYRDLKKGQHISNIVKFDMITYVDLVYNSGNELTIIENNFLLKFTKSKNDVLCVILNVQPMASSLSEIKHLVLNKLNYLIGNNRDNVVLDIANEINKLTVETMCKNI